MIQYELERQASWLKLEKRTLDLKLSIIPGLNVWTCAVGLELLC